MNLIEIQNIDGWIKKFHELYVKLDCMLSTWHSVVLDSRKPKKKNRIIFFYTHSNSKLLIKLKQSLLKM